MNKKDKNLGFILFLKKHSNIFIVLLNYKKKHIITLTSGFCKLGKTKKQKTSTFNMLNFILNLKKYLLKFNIKYLIFYLKQRFTSHFYNLKKMFKLHDIIIKKYIFLLHKPHSTLRGKKLRRI